MTPSHEQWAAQARYDFEVATTLFESGRYLYVMFFCQQTVEKMLKSIIAKRSNQTPPRIHNLMQLAQRAGIEVNEERAGFFRELSQYYIQSRYPEELSAIAGGITPQLAGATIVRTEAAIQWLSSIM
jgi:HEPN domain-containing protein